MALSTFSKIYYGHAVNENNLYINFDEGSGELTAEITPGGYSLTEFASQVELALNAAGLNTYTVTINRSNPSLTISSTGTFDLLFDTGAQAGQSARLLLGYNELDYTGASSYVAPNISGSVYSPQFILQDFVDKDDFEGLIDPSINKSASGVVEVIKYGTENFIEFNLKYISNELLFDNRAIKNDANGLTNTRSFLKYAITKAKFELMLDEGDENTYYTCMLEKTASSSNGTQYKLREQVTRNLPNIYETGLLTLRIF